MQVRKAGRYSGWLDLDLTLRKRRPTTPISPIVAVKDPETGRWENSGSFCEGVRSAISSLKATAS